MPDLLPFLGEIAWRSSLVLAVAFACLLAMRQASASERHLVLSLALIVTTLFPLALLLSPKVTWTISLPHQVEKSPPLSTTTVYSLRENEPAVAANSTAVVENKYSLANFYTVTNGLIALFTAGMLVQAAMLGRAAWTWRGIRQHAEEASLPEAVLGPARFFTGERTVPPIFISDQVSVPVLVGWLRPGIILPANSVKWPSRRLLMVLCHELAHYRRGDSRLLPMIGFLRVFYWWHPLVWLGLARLRREREKACDDLVLNQNFRATDYADLIVLTARQAQALSWQDGALAMATSSNVSERIRAILNPGLNRRQASRTMVITILMLAFGLGWFFAAAEVQAADSPAPSDNQATTDPSKPKIELDFRLISINEKTYLSHQKKIDAEVANRDLDSLINLINNLPGADLLSAPSVTTQEGLRADVDIVREMPFATRFDKDKDGKVVPSDFATRDTGLLIEATPTLTGDMQYVGLKFKCTLISFEGWKESPAGGQRPIFDRASIQTERLIGKSGDAVWVGSGTTRAYMAEENGNDGPPSTNDIAPKRILLLISARPLPAEVQTAAVPSNAMVRVDLKYFQISEKTYAQQTATVASALAMNDALKRGDMSYFSRLPDFDLLTEPAILTKIGEQGVLEAVKKMSYPAKLVRDGMGHFIPSGAVTDRNVGIRFFLRPELLADGTISISCFDEITSFEGWIKTGSQEERPCFNVSRLNGKYGLASGKSLGTWVRTNIDDQSKSENWKAGDPPFPPLQNLPKVRIAMIMTTKLYAPDGSPLPSR